MYRPIHRTTVATLILVHGFGEHSDRYAPMCNRFARAGIRVATYDQRGFGKSGLRSGRPGQTDGFDRLVDDLSFICSRVYQPDMPTVLFGHAMGALVALYYANSPVTRLPVMGVIAQAAAFITNTDLQPNRVTVTFAHMAAKVNKRMTRRVPIPPEYLTRDENVVAEFTQNNNNYQVGSLQCLADLLKKGSELLTGCVSWIGGPVLITHGEQDKITSHEGSIRFFEKLPYHCDKELKIYLNCYHELHHEPEKDEIIDYYIEWSLKRVELFLPHTNHWTV
ncbi:hypothetical protein IWQ61_001626 [Dispira simplex]|nr:hypothetical protein IWQ61_001626 [Dispira simplex]